jgi:hypothetical protein
MPPWPGSLVVNIRSDDMKAAEFFGGFLTSRGDDGRFYGKLHQKAQRGKAATKGV